MIMNYHIIDLQINRIAARFQQMSVMNRNPDVVRMINYGDRLFQQIVKVKA